MGGIWNTKFRRWTLDLALFAASGTAAALAFEAAARLWVKVPPPVELRDGAYVSGLPLINAHPSCRWVPTVEGAPLQAARRPGELRVFVFGESSVQGSPWGYAGSAPVMLRDELGALLPGRPVTVVNMGRACASMMDAYYYLLSAAPYRPDVVIFYQGSNDRFDADIERCMPASRPALHSIWRFAAARSRLLWAARALAPQWLRRREDRALAVPAPPGAPRCDQDEAFAAWTRILIRAARGLGAEVIVTAPVRNPLLPMELAAWSAKPASLRETIKGLSPAYRERLRCELTPGCPAPLPDAAAPAEAEIEGRARAWKASAGAEGARFADFRSRLAGAARPGEGTGRFFVGETHLTLEGYGLLASLWARETAALLADGTPPRETAPSRARRYEDDLRESGVPVGPVFYSEGMAYLGARMLLLAAPSFRQAAARGVEDARLVLGGLRREAGLPPGPDAPAARLARFDLDGHLKRGPAPAAPAPSALSAGRRAALDAFAAGKLDETEAAAGRVLRADPSDATALLLRGAARLRKRRLPEAFADFNALVLSAPGNPEVLADALSSRGEAREGMGDKPGAAEDYARCLRVAPPGWKRRAAVESLLRAAH